MSRPSIADPPPPGGRMPGNLATGSFVCMVVDRQWTVTRARVLFGSVLLGMIVAAAGSHLLGGSVAAASPGLGATLAAAVGSAVLAALVAATVAALLLARLARRHRESAPVHVRAHTAYLRVAPPADPDRPGHARPRAPGRHCP